MNAPIKKTIAREFTFKFLYHFFIKENQETLNELIESGARSALLDEEIESFKSSFAEDETETKIEENLKGWTLSKLDKVDHCVLITIASELLYTKDLAPQIIINEGINMAKKFGSKDSSSFINGVLDAMAKKL